MKFSLIVRGQHPPGDTAQHLRDDLELVLVGPNLYHAWFSHQCKSEEIREVTIQWHKDLFEDKLLRRNQLSFIRSMMERSQKGILFSRETAAAVAPRILALNQKKEVEVPLVATELTNAGGSK